MEVKQLHGLCYSATGVTEKVVRALAAGLEEELGLPQAVFHGFRKPAERAVDYVFGPGDLVVVGSPTYAGRERKSTRQNSKHKARSSKKS